jgi:para-nitrobenzyl esterase
MLSLILLCFQLLSTTAWPWNPKVSTTNGIVEGYEADDVLIFHSIPFAQPPVGRLRFRPPIYPAAPLSGVKNVKNQPSICPQLKVTSLFHMGKEDCLNLHVYVPKIHPKIHQDGLYKGSNIAKATNSIVVAVNYRVGPFGFLSHDVLQREDQNGSTGNMGVRDQQAGLKWVRDNIAAFNGDPQ